MNEGGWWTESSMKIWSLSFLEKWGMALGGRRGLGGHSTYIDPALSVSQIVGEVESTWATDSFDVLPSYVSVLELVGRNAAGAELQIAEREGEQLWLICLLSGFSPCNAIIHASDFMVRVPMRKIMHFWRGGRG